MTTSSYREIRLNWPLDPNTGMTLGQAKRAWADWLAELDACGATDDTPVGATRNPDWEPPGLIARWEDPRAGATETRQETKA